MHLIILSYPTVLYAQVFLKNLWLKLTHTSEHREFPDGPVVGNSTAGAEAQSLKRGTKVSQTL